MIPGTLKSNKSRIIVLPVFVFDELARTCEGEDHKDLLWTIIPGQLPGPSCSALLAV